MRAFNRLVWTEWRNVGSLTKAAAGAILLYHAVVLLILFVSAEMYRDLFFEAGNLAFALIILVVALSIGAVMWASDRLRKTDLLLFSLPVSRSLLLLAKSVAALSVQCLLLGLMFAGMWLQGEALHQMYPDQPQYPWSDMGWEAEDWTLAVLLLILNVAALLGTVSFSTLLALRFRYLGWIGALAVLAASFLLLVGPSITYVMLSETASSLKAYAAFGINGGVALMLALVCFVAVLQLLRKGAIR